ncbi:MAG: GAF domain-containing protein [Humibacillus sp.]|nr:GAF domain-containing protein [Humibacillus sp.]
MAGDATDDEVFAAVDRALAHVASADFSVLIRFEPDDGLAVVALDGSAASTEPALLPLLEAAVVRSLRAVGRPERWNDLNLAEKLPFITGSRPATRCALAVPIQTGISSWGLEVLVADQEDAFGGVTDELFTDALDVIRPMLAWSEASRDLRHVELERAQLRRVAEVAASATDLEELFVALTRAASAVLHGHPTSLVCYDDDAHGILVATHGGGAVAGDIGTPSAVSVPIMVGRQVWGSLAAGSIGDSLPLDAEERLSMFVGIMAAWIESAQVRDDLAAMADEQAALRRVAELMVLDVSQEKLFDAVASQAAELVNECTTLVRVDNETSCTVVGVGRSAVATGTRIAVSAERGLVAQVCRTRSPARVDDHPTHPGRAEASNQRSLRSSVGVPVIVSNKVWGVLGCTSWEHRLRPGTERRLEQFAALVAAALANAEARAHVQNLADEQSALRRVADLAALEAPAEEVMQAVADEAARLSGVEFTSLLRFGGDGSSSVVSLAGAPNGIAVGMRAPLKGEGAIPQVWRTARPARIDDLSQVRGGWAEVVADRGFSATVAVPIFIRGHLWGVLVVVSTDRPLPAGTEDHLVNFAELAGTGISAAQARVELRAVAEEQTALRRVAELVARGAPLEQVLAATAREASTLMRGLAAALMQYGGDEEAVVVAASNSPAPVGLRVPLTPDTGTGLVKQTGKPHRVDDFATTSLAAVAADLGIVGAVTVPVIVEGTVWGMLSTTSAGPPIPPETESRLTQFAELAAAAIAAAQNKNALLASRRRVLTTADETRRRVQRDVHDGAQQQLVHTIINLKLAREAMTAGDGQAERLITEALRSAERASQELRDLVHGILPAALTLGGLRRGVVSLADDLTLPVSIRVEAPRLSTKLETTAYFVVAEALTNVVKHARAGHARVDVVLVGDVLVIDVVDDGAGGADAASGTGLTGLQDRVQASDGILTVSSPPGGGTHLQARIPVTEPND